MLEGYVAPVLTITRLMLNPAQIKLEFDSVIADAQKIEPQLAKRLQQLSRWIKDKKPGLLTKKRLVMDLIVEVMQDAKLWLKIQELSDDEKDDFERQAQLTPPELYWYQTLFPEWFNQPDDKLKIWTQKIMADEYPQQDRELINGFIGEFERLPAPVLSRYILDLSMATDLMVSGQSQNPLAVQLTITNPDLLTEKQDRWKETLIFWSIKRGLLFSQSPRHPLAESAKSIFLHSDSIEDGCYVVDSSASNHSN